MRTKDKNEAARLEAALIDFHKNMRPLPGIQTPTRRRVFLEQLLESIHRIQFIDRGVLYHRNQPRAISPDRANPSSDLFDPIKGAAFLAGQGEHDEACWLVFLFVHFGKHARTGYQLARDVYGSLGNGPRWDWDRTSSDPQGFRNWLAANQHTLKNVGTPRLFGNHRKYVSLDAHSDDGTGAAFATYVDWVIPHRTHAGLFNHAATERNNVPRQMFDYLFRTMDMVASFGRLGCFDYLTMIAKLQLANIEPGSPYLARATGPRAGTKLLFGTQADGVRSTELDRWIVELEGMLGVDMGMQVLEDALCNWQKSPDVFVPFRA